MPGPAGATAALCSDSLRLRRRGGVPLRVRLRDLLSMFSTRYRAVGGLTRRIDEILLSFMPWSLTFR
jgi:hypothetical protein